MNAVGFTKSQEAAFRRVWRDCVKASKLTRAEKAVVLAFLNHWFAHRHKGAVHPGRKKLAKRAEVCERSVKYTLAMMREFGVVRAIAFASGNENGLRGKSTEYTLCLHHLAAFCKLPAASLKVHRRPETGAKPYSGGKNAPLKGAQNAPRSTDAVAIPFPVQRRA